MKATTPRAARWLSGLLVVLVAVVMWNHTRDLQTAPIFAARYLAVLVPLFAFATALSGLSWRKLLGSMALGGLLLVLPLVVANAGQAKMPSTDWIKWWSGYNTVGWVVSTLLGMVAYSGVVRVGSMKPINWSRLRKTPDPTPAASGTDALRSKARARRDPAAREAFDWSQLRPDLSGFKVGKLLGQVALGLVIVLGFVPVSWLIVRLYQVSGQSLTQYYWGGPNLGHVSPGGVACWFAGSITLYIGSFINCWPAEDMEVQGNRRVIGAMAMALTLLLFSGGAYLTLVAVTTPQTKLERLQIEAAAATANQQAAPVQRTVVTPSAPEPKARAIKPPAPAGSLTARQTVALGILLLAQIMAAIMVLRATKYRPDLVGLGQVLPVIIALIPIMGSYVAARSVDAGMRPVAVSVIGVVASIVIWFV